jgi:hypothetical protein
MYDVKKRSLAPTDWLMLRMNFEVGGAIVNRIVDVVSEGGVAKMIARYNDARQLGVAALGRHGGVLHDIQTQRRNAFWSASSRRDFSALEY